MTPPKPRAVVDLDIVPGRAIIYVSGPVVAHVVGAAAAAVTPVYQRGGVSSSQTRSGSSITIELRMIEAGPLNAEKLEQAGRLARDTARTFLKNLGYSMGRGRLR